jgi:hypothetical protein
MGAVRAWILQHDESWLFTISYVGLAVVLSIWISLFWLVAVVGVHFILEWIRQSHFAERSRDVLRRSLWELKLDGALILFAFALTAYLEVILGMAGLAGASRMGLQAGARFAGWSRVLRGVLLSLVSVPTLVLGGLVLMPLLLGMPAFAPLMMEPMRPVAMGSLMGHLIFGLILGTTAAWLRGRAWDRTLAA